MGLVKSRVKKEMSKEYYRFRRSVLHKRKHDIFESCQKILFYASVYEYFLYNPHINESMLRRFLMFHLSIEKLWECYLRNESTTVTTWKGIEELIQLASEWEGEQHEQCKTGAC